MNQSGPMTECRETRPLYSSIQEAAKHHEMRYGAFKQYARRNKIIFGRDPKDRRRKLVPLSAYTPVAYSRWLKGQQISSNIPPKPILETSQAIGPTAQTGPQLQAFLPFHPESEIGSGLTAAIPSNVPSRYQPYIDKLLAFLPDACNGSWKRYEGYTICGVLVVNRSTFLRGLADLHNVGRSTLYDKRKIVLDCLREGKPSEILERLLPKPRPGRTGHTYFDDSENAWACLSLERFYLNQAKLSVSRAWELLCLEIDAKRRAWGPGHSYPKPTVKMCRTFLKKIDLPTLTFAREGEKAYNDRCGPYISRRPPDHANDVWVTDQRECNVRLRDGGNHLGRVWVVNFLDVTSWRWLGAMFGPLVNSDMVMAAAAMSLERAGVPHAVHMDLGKEFTGKRFLGGVFAIRGETLFRDAVGLWERLGVQVIRAIGRNPQSKIIERWHRELDRFDQEMPGWCGSNPGERPEKLACEEAAHFAWLETGRGYSPLLGIPEYINRYLDFCERRWNSEHRGKGRYLQGMTPSEAWNTRLPKDLRTLTREEVEFYTADHRFLKVARGGQVNLTFHGQTIEYEAPELSKRQDEEVEVIVSRRSIRQVTVIYSVPGGKASCAAPAKPLHDWLPENRDELRQALRCRAALKRAVKRGLAAQQALTESTNLRELPAIAAEIAPEVAATFAAPGPRPDQEISGAEWMSRKRSVFANERAAAVLATLDEEDA
jgi:hypothetical protein